MGSSRPRNSSRAGKAHPRTLKSRRKSAQPQPPKTRTPADALRNVERIGKTRPVAERLRISPTRALHKMRDDAPATALRQIHARLARISSTAIVVAHALREQNVQLDDDAACVLRWHVSDPLFEQILRLKRIIDRGAP